MAETEDNATGTESSLLEGGHSLVCAGILSSLFLYRLIRPDDLLGYNQLKIPKIYQTTTIKNNQSNSETSQTFALVGGILFNITWSVTSAVGVCSSASHAAHVRRNKRERASSD